MKIMEIDDQYFCLFIYNVTIVKWVNKYSVVYKEKCMHLLLSRFILSLFQYRIYPIIISNLKKYNDLFVRLSLMGY